MTACDELWQHRFKIETALNRRKFLGSKRPSPKRRLPSPDGYLARRPDLTQSRPVAVALLQKGSVTRQP